MVNSNSNASTSNGEPGGFSRDQMTYLQGFAMGSDVARRVRGLPILSGSGHAGTTVQVGATATVAATPQAAAQDRFIAAGKKLSKEEQAKRDKDPLDLYDAMHSTAAKREFPKGTDVFLWKFHGLFYVAPAQDSYMCRLRIPGGELKSFQLRGIANLAESHAAGHFDCTTRANLQIREIPAAHGPAVLQELQELGLVIRGSGADNIRNVTSSATSGIDALELIDTLPLAKAMHHHILNHKELYGLPRKFNIAFDGGGKIATLEETNDIAFQAVRIAAGENAGEVFFKLALGGITGHQDIARDTGVLLRPEECVPTAHAILRVFLDHGDRTDRKKARLKYVLDSWGFDKFIAEVEQQLGGPLRRVEQRQLELPQPPDRWAHVGVHEQKEPEFCYVGIVLPVGRMTSEQGRQLANLSERFGSGRVRLTVWQNLLIPDVAAVNVDALVSEIERIGLDWRASSVRSGLVACTGNAGCKFAAADTKGQAMKLAAYLDERIELDTPVNIHVTGCPNSCAQHYIGDIGLRGTAVEAGEEMVEGYEIVVGGGYADRQGIGRQLFPAVAFDDIPPLVERLLSHYLEQRSGPSEPFAEFVRRCELETLREVSGYLAAV